MSKDHHDKKTPDMLGEKRKPGPKPSGKALTSAQRQRKYRDRVRAQMAELKALKTQKNSQAFRDQSGPVLPHPSKIDRFED